MQDYTDPHAVIGSEENLESFKNFRSFLSEDADQAMAGALALLVSYGSIDGDHHKTWVIDQVTRALTGGNYNSLVAYAKGGEDGPETYDWDTGIAP